MLLSEAGVVQPAESNPSTPPELIMKVVQGSILSPALSMPKGSSKDRRMFGTSFLDPEQKSRLLGVFACGRQALVSGILKAEHLRVTWWFSPKHPESTA
jgi:hypothetical protein